MAKPLISQTTIFDAALQLLDAEGIDALSMRNLAAALQCSPRTLYQQVGKREDLIRQLLQYHFDQLHFEFNKNSSWEDSILNWAAALRATLCRHPNLSRLITIDQRDAVVSYVNPLLKTLLNLGFPEELALRSCRVLAHQVIGLCLTEIETPSDYRASRKRSPQELQFEDLIIRATKKTDSGDFQALPEIFDTSIRWTVAGIKQSLAIEQAGKSPAKTNSSARARKK